MRTRSKKYEAGETSVKREFDPSQPESKPSVKLETDKPTLKPEGKENVKPEPNAKPEPGPSPKLEPGPSVKPEPGSISENESKPNVKDEAEGPQPQAGMQASEDEEEGPCDCGKCEHERKENDALWGGDIRHLIINLGAERMSFEKDEYGDYRCPEAFCRYSHRRSERVRRHYKIHCPGQYQCKLCDRRFNQRGSCMNHIRTHDDKYKFKCPEDDCDAKFANQRYLKRHAMKEHGLDLGRRSRFWSWDAFNEDGELRDSDDDSREDECSIM